MLNRLHGDSRTYRKYHHYSDGLKNLEYKAFLSIANGYDDDEYPENVNDCESFANACVNACDALPMGPLMCARADDAHRAGGYAYAQAPRAYDRVHELRSSEGTRRTP